jgi:hypothetical protein
MTIQESFNKHKRFLEKIDIAKYKVIWNGTFFHVAAYNRFGRTKGYLFVHENGEVCKRENIIEPYKLFITFNSYMFGLYEQGQAEINKPTEIFEQTIKLLNQIKPFVPSSMNSVDNVILKINELEVGFTRIKNIHSETMKVYEDMISKGILDEKVVNEVDNLMSEFTELQYKHLYLQMEFKEHFEIIVKELNDVIVILNKKDKKIAKKAIDVFKFLSGKKFRSGIHESLSGFETDLNGNQISFYSNPDWKVRLSSNCDEKNKHKFETNILSMLRN